MSGWPGDMAPLPHAATEDRLRVRLAGMVADDAAVIRAMAILRSTNPSAAVLATIDQIESEIAGRNEESR